MRVAITGGSGFVGSKLVSAHLARGDKVNILTRTGTKSSSEDCKVFSGDITQPNLIPPEFFMDVDVVYHCAGELRDPFKIESVNVDGTRNLLNSAAGKIRRWVQVSSVGVYGIPNIQNVDESAPLQPLNSYEATKMEAERLAVNFASRFGFDYVILRPSTIYGYGMPSTSLYQLANFVRRGLFFFLVRGWLQQIMYISIMSLVHCYSADSIPQRQIKFTMFPTIRQWKNWSSKLRTYMALNDRVFECRRTL